MEHNAESGTGHRQVHRPATGDSECTCGQWVGPMTVIPASDPRSFAAHVESVTSPGEPDTWNCPRPGCGAEMVGGLFCRTCGQARS